MDDVRLAKDAKEANRMEQGDRKALPEESNAHQINTDLFELFGPRCGSHGNNGALAAQPREMERQMPGSFRGSSSSLGIHPDIDQDDIHGDLRTPGKIAWRDMK